MRGTVFITDTIFVDEEDEALIRRNGFDIARNPSPNLSEADLCGLIPGKVGYILGGIEKFTPKVLEAANQLRVISFCGTGFQNYIPAYREAGQRGISITNVPGRNAMAVAEYGLALMLAMTRDLGGLTRWGQKKFQSVRSVNEMEIGIVGLGHIGRAFANMLRPLSPRALRYFNRNRNMEAEKECGAQYTPLDELVRQSDVIFLSLPYTGGAPVLSGTELGRMKKGALIVNIARPGLVDFAALRPHILNGDLKAAYDIPPAENFSDLPPDRFLCSNASTAYNTFSANKAIGKTAVESMLNVLETGKDRFLVVP